METRLLISVVIIVAFAVIASFPVSQSSQKRDPVRGGPLAKLFHHLGILAYLAIVPSALIGSLLVGAWEFGIPFAFSSLAVAVVFLLLYALVEKPTRANLPQEDRGWTEQDARTSGL